MSLRLASFAINLTPSPDSGLRTARNPTLQPCAWRSSRARARVLRCHSEVTQTPSKRSDTCRKQGLTNSPGQLCASLAFAAKLKRRPASPPNLLLHQVSLPRQLSEECVAQFMLDLPLLHEDQLSPALLACAAKLRSQFTDASSKAQTGIRDMREAWIAWHALPVISPPSSAGANAFVYKRPNAAAGSTRRQSHTSRCTQRAGRCSRT